MNNTLKSVVTIVLMILFTMVSNELSAQKTKTIEFHTSAQCGMCKDAIEGAMNFERGIQFVELNLDNMFLTVKYKTKIHTEKSV